VSAWKLGRALDLMAHSQPAQSHVMHGNEGGGGGSAAAVPSQTAGTDGIGGGGTARDLAVAWIRSFIVANAQTDSSGESYLTSFVSVDSLYDAFLDEHSDERTDLSALPSRSTFADVLKRDFRTFHRRVRAGSFSRCETCSALDIQSRSRLVTDTERALIQQTKSAHTALHIAERHLMQGRIAACQERPDQLHVLTVDYTSIEGIPHLLKPPRRLSRVARVCIHVMGLIDFATGQKRLIFHSDSVAKSANSVATALLLHIMAVRLAPDCKQSADTELCLQTDSGSENKNRCILLLLAWLVASGCYRAARFDQLPPGHAHADVDRLFVPVKGVVTNNETSYHSLTSFLHALSDKLTGRVRLSVPSRPLDLLFRCLTVAVLRGVCRVTCRTP
jgi:hypothetical protein